MKEIIKIRKSMRQRKEIKWKKKIDETESWFYEIKKVDKPLARQIRKQKDTIIINIVSHVPLNMGIMF